MVFFSRSRYINGTINVNPTSTGTYMIAIRARFQSKNKKKPWQANGDNG